MKVSSNAAKYAAAIQAGSVAVASRVAYPITIPLTNIAARMRLVSRSEAMRITIEARAALADANLPIDNAGMSSIGVIGEYRSEEIVRIMAAAVLHATKEEPIASVEEWRECSDEQLTMLFRDYNDISAQADPLGDGEFLAADQFAIIDSAAKKKDLVSLIACGSRSLAIYIATLAAPQSILPIPS